MSDDDFEIRPGRIRQRGSGAAKPKSLAAQVRALSNKAGRIGIGRRGGRGTGRHGRGRNAVLRLRRHRGQRRVLVKARVVRHQGSRYSAAPLSRHIAYLERDGVTRDGKDAEMFGSDDGPVDGNAFATRCVDDRHHFRFIVSPEDAGEMADLRAFTRELLTDMEADLGTSLDWVAVDHWNTDNPHIHILLRGRTDDGRDLVIDKDYIREGLRGRAEERVTIELGLRSEREIDNALAREVDADRWTSLDARLQRMADERGGVIDLRPDPQRNQNDMDRHLIGRAGKLERMELATRLAPACWSLGPGLQPTLRALAVRGDIIKTMHRAMTGTGVEPDTGRFAMHDNAASDPVIGCLVERGLDDELTGSAYALALLCSLLLFTPGQDAWAASNAGSCPVPVEDPIGPDAERLLKQPLTSQAARDSINKLLDQPPFENRETVTRWRIGDEPKKSAEEPSKEDMEGLAKILKGLGNLANYFKKVEIVATIFEVLLWTALISLIVLLLWRYREWLSTFASRLGLPQRRIREMPSQLFGLELAPESLPDDVASAVERLWAEQPREALGLLYRALLSRLLHDFRLPLKGSHTEGEVLQLVQRLEQSELHRFSAVLTGHWQNLAYGHRLPPQALKQSLCDAWRRLFPAGATA